MTYKKLNAAEYDELTQYLRQVNRERGLKAAATRKARKNTAEWLDRLFALEDPRLGSMN